jgi:hypothetical protein
VPEVLAVIIQRRLPAAPTVPAVVIGAQLLHPGLNALLKLLLVERHIIGACLQADSNARM